MNNNENIEVKNENKIISVLKGIGIFLALLLSYLLVPQFVGLFVYSVFKLNETISMFIGNVSYAIILIVVYFKMFKEKIVNYYKNFALFFGDTLKLWGIGLLVMFISNLFLAYVVFGGEVASNEAVNRAYILENPITGFILVALLAPFVEEMIFRYGLRKLTGKSKYFPLVSAIVFGVPHIIAGISLPFGVDDLLQFLYVIPYGALGYVFGYIYNKTDNIFCSMSAHFMHNFMCFMVILLFV